MPASTTETNNYVLGRGEVFIDVWENSAETGIYRFLGNAPEFNISQAVEKLDHFASTSGLRVKDASVVTEVSMNGRLTVDNVSNDNLGLWFSGTGATETQTATGGGSPITETAVAMAGRYYQMGSTDAAKSLRNLTDFTIARENTGYNQVTAATAASAGSGMTNGTRIFTITDGTGTNQAVLSATVSGGAISGAITVVSGGRYSVNPDTTANASATVDSGTVNATFDLTMGAMSDATLSTDQYEFDGTTGILFLKADADEFVDGDTINLGYKKLGATRETLQASGQPITCSVRYISNNANGVARHYYFPKVDLSADGDFALIGQEWQQMSFGFEALQATTNAPRAYVDGNPLLT